ncbi:hypothetical protein TNCV_606301 [Trichonephila clavipes]|nr:hypothetical protein TNCV_606301 [Trichonephila clavipes]
MNARAYCGHPSIRDHWALRCMSRYPDQMVILKRDFQCLSPYASLVLIYLPTHGSMNERLSRPPSPGIEPGPVEWKSDTIPLDQWAFNMIIVVITEKKTQNYEEESFIIDLKF